MRSTRATRRLGIWKVMILPLFVAALVNCGGSDKAVAPKGTISLSSESITFNTEQGGANPASQPVEITNSAGGSLTELTATITYGASQPTGWLTASLSQVTAPSTLTLQAATGSLAPGNYTATVAIAGTGADNSPRNIAVTFKVAALAGYPTEFTDVSGHQPNYLLGHVVVVPANATLASVNMIIKAPLTAGSQVKVGIYTDVSGSPGTLVASTPATTIVLGRNEIPLTATALTAGNYWFMVTLDNGVNLGKATAVPMTIKYISHTFANALPTTFPTGAVYSAQAFNVFLKTNTP